VFLIMKSYKVRQVQMLPFSHLAHLALSLNLKIKLHVFIFYFIKLSISFYLLLDNVLKLLIMIMFHVYQLHREIVVYSNFFFVDQNVTLHLAGVLPKYFNSEWSIAPFHLHEGNQYTVAFGLQKNIVIRMEGMICGGVIHI
jgi:hypothetical protein